MISSEKLVEGKSNGGETVWTGALTATVTGKLKFRFPQKTAHGITSPFPFLVLVSFLLIIFGVIGFIYARKIQKPHPRMSRALSATSTIMIILASFFLERVFGRQPQPPAPIVPVGIPEDPGEILPIDHEVRLAIEAL